ncbi:hypothetical protein HNR65_000254 [Desulfosalsimonas propionicica]|uniref:Putative membrane protein insertion efficiency factor n=1 Tax=Desulfosalsimonas propionicica TaxID=332175 RepID=A0A7W0HJ95_9BACT|nr:hypothetical protein [Desulfosalsimonas propionicica]
MHRWKGCFARSGGAAIKYFLLFSIRLYQCLLSPVIGSCCRFYPTCSEYAYESIRRFGAIRGGWLALKRLAKCHPFHPGGIDPVLEAEDQTAAPICTGGQQSD